MVDPKTARNVVHQDLGLKPYVRTLIHLFTDSLKARILERAKKVRSYIRLCGSTVKLISDEKILVVDTDINIGNDQCPTKSQDDVVGTFRTKQPAKVMVFGVVVSDGKKMPPFFFKPGEGIGADAYYKVLRYHVLPCLKVKYPNGDYVWT